MKKAVFITHPDLTPVVYEHPWHKQGRVFNSKSLDLPPENGLLTLLTFFDCKKPVKCATVRATALGMFDLRLNNQRIGVNTPDGKVFDELKPGWTDYRCRVFQFTYDITDMLREENCFTAQVSNGWWSGRISFGFYGFKLPAFCGEIEVEYEDGTADLIASDESWDAAICGPVMTADIWDGEYFDARMPHPCDFPGAYKWTKAVLDNDFEGVIQDPVGPPIRVRADLTRYPLSATLHCGVDEDGSDFGKIHVLSKRVGRGCEATKLKAGESILLDMGQDMVGRPSIVIRAARGTIVRGYVAEMLNDSGDRSRGNDGPRDGIYIENYRSALARIYYVAAGTGDEAYKPTFAFYGFRYLELTADSDWELVSACGEVITSVDREVGEITTSNPEVNQLISNVLWGQRGNYLSIPTDCPQRDERLGWSGDTQIFVGAGSYQMNVDGFMRKWLQDARDSQVGFEGFCDVIPRVFGDNHSANSAWGDAGLVVPYRLWLMYNDTELIAEHYEAMEYYMDHLQSRNGMEGPRPVYGDWLNYDVTDKAYISLSWYAYDAELMVLFSNVLGKADRAAYYTDLRNRIVALWRERYVNEAGDDLTIGTQTAYLLALRFKLVEDSMREILIRKLEQKIIDNNYTLSTGFVGTGVLNQTLSELGLDHLAYSLLLQTADPSWLYSVRQGATTIWERWNSYTLATGFGAVSMNSFNHYAYGAVLEWMYASMAGISPDPEQPGFGHFILSPRPDTRRGDALPEGQEPITFVKARYDSVCGTIRAAWEFEQGKFVYRVTIPEGTSARVEFPLLNGTETVTVNALSMTAEELGGKIVGGKMVFELTAGEYKIV